MATIRPRTQLPVGSVQWIFDERRQAASYVAQEVEEFQFSAQNDMEWLNEHMSDIFNRQQFDVAEAFKTPGKLRGKTPRTARKRVMLEGRAPLTDLFSATPQPAATSPNRAPFMKKLTEFQVAEDKDDSHIAPPVVSARHSFGMGKENTDSGYHGMTEDEMDVDVPSHEIVPLEQISTKPHYILSPPKPQRALSPAIRREQSPQRYDSQDTFVSAEEGVSAGSGDEYVKSSASAAHAESDNMDVDEDVAPKHQSSVEVATFHLDHSAARSQVTGMGLNDAGVGHLSNRSPLAQEMSSAESSPASDISSPHRQVVRKKSSLTFASLPAREPLANKKSMGTRMSRVSHDEQTRPTAIVREGRLDNQTTGKSITDETAGLQEDVELNVNQQHVGNSPSAKQISMTSTQRLQERLAMLGKPTAPRISKSIPSNAAISRSSTSKLLRDNVPRREEPGQDENEESWIGPMAGGNAGEIHPRSMVDVQAVEPVLENSRRRSSRHSNNAESEKTAVTYPVLPPPKNMARFNEERSVQADAGYPELPTAINSADVDALGLNKHDGPLSASKAKLFSVFKSAKGIFASSASASAQAKLIASHPRLVPTRSNQQDEFRSGPVSMPPTQSEIEKVGTVTIEKELPPAPKRSSDRLKAASKASENVQTQDPPAPSTVSSSHALAGNDEAATYRTEPTKPLRDMEIDHHHELDEFPPVPPPKSQTSLLQKHGEIRRPGRLAKETAPKARPAPVSIKLRGFQGQGLSHFGPSGRSANPPQDQESAAPSVPPKHPTLSKKASNSSIQTSSSTQTYKTTATSASARPKALEAAARKKEQDEREAQRKADQKREIERRRAAKADEERRAAKEQKLAEQQANEAKQQALREAAEHRKAEAIRRNEQLRLQAANARSRQADESSFVAPNSRQPPAQNQHRAEQGAARPLSRMASNTDLSRPAVPHVNPAKPPKRQFNGNEDDDRVQRSQPTRSGPNDMPPSKRRRTSEDSLADTVSRPTMAPPVRPSMMRKDTNPRPLPTYPSNNAQSQPSQPSHSMMKTVVTAQHQMQHPKTPHMNDLAKFSNAKIPFADSANSALAGPSYSQQQHRIQQTLKTPGTHKSSPQYPNGDSIELPEVATDSEDSGEEDDFIPPDWANSPALRELLQQQQLVDPLKVFGPIAPLVMEEVFKGNKERHAKFRKRTSSANWNGPDRLTEEERRKDQVARERLEREGGWTFNPTPNK